MTSTTTQPQFVQNLTEIYGIVTVLNEDDVPINESWIEYSQFYGDASHCDFHDDDCSDDGVLWQANDFGSPYFCTNHTFPQEQLGYSFMLKTDLFSPEVLVAEQTDNGYILVNDETDFGHFTSFDALITQLENVTDLSELTEPIQQCVYCGDSCGQEVCYSCEDTANDMGLDAHEIMF